MAGYDPKKANPTSIIPEAPAKITRKKKKPKEIAVVTVVDFVPCEDKHRVKQASWQRFV